MVTKNNKQCVCCGQRYTYCSNCRDFDHLPAWMAIFHDVNCKEIFNTIASYNNKHITKEQAKDTLDKCDLSNKDMLKQSLQDKINEIYIIEKNEKIQDFEIANGTEQINIEELSNGDITEDSTIVRQDEFKKKEVITEVLNPKKRKNNRKIYDNE